MNGKKTLDSKVFNKALNDNLGGPPPYIGPKGGLWADALHTIHWTKPERAAEAVEPFYLRGRPTNISSASGKQELPLVEDRKSSSSVNSMGAARLNLNNQEGEDKEQGQRGGVEPMPMSMPGLEGYSGASGEPVASIGDTEIWYKDFGLKDDMGWNGKWQETPSENPERFDLQKINDVERHASRLRNMRVAEKFPESILKIAVGFLLMSELPSVGMSGKSKIIEDYQRIEQWILNEDREIGDLEEALSGEIQTVQKRLKYNFGKSLVNVLAKGVSKFADDGQALRSWLIKHHEFKEFGNNVLSYVLKILGYTDVSSFGERTVLSLTGAIEDDALKIVHELSNNSKLYSAFEDEIKNTPSYNEEDPKGIRLPLAEWRIWSEHGEDDPHDAFWSGIGIMTGFNKLSKAHSVKQNHIDLLAAAFAFSYHALGSSSPIIYDAIPILSFLYGEDIGMHKSFFVVRMSLSKAGQNGD